MALGKQVARFPGVELPKLNDLSEVKNMLEERVKEWTKQWQQQGLEKGIQKAHLEDAKNMLKEGIDVAVIARVTGLGEEEIEKLR